MPAPSRYEDYPLIARCSLFRNVSMETIEHLLETCEIWELATGGELLTLGAPPSDYVYIVLAGRLHVHVDVDKVVPYVVLEAGELAGEMSSLDGRAVSATVEAAQECRLLAIPKATLWSLILTSHAVAVNVALTLAGRLRLGNQTLLESFTRQNELQRVATVDALTGLHNRRWMDDTFSRQLRRSAVSREPVSLIMIDIDNFKPLNDRFGHLTGDRVLCNVGTILVTHLRPQDLIVRYGGEEFCVLLPGATREMALGFAERIRVAVMNSGADAVLEDVDRLPGVTVSLGVAQAQESSLHSLLSAADAALYFAKRTGKNRVCG